MYKPTVFLITGYARAGKDTLADRIAAITGARKVAFADSLKDAGNRFFTSLGIESVDLKQNDHKVAHRELLVAMGKAARSVDVDIFARHAAEKARYNILAGRCVVMPDWRYENEHQVVHQIVYPAPVVRVLISTYGITAANDEEDNSIHKIMMNGVANFECFKPGDLAAIDDWAHELASLAPKVLGA
jgi:hypothetical protein